MKNKILTLLIILCGFVYIGQAQDAYYWRDQQKCYLEPYLKQWFILAEDQTDTSLIANQLQKEGISYRPFEKLSVGISDFDSKNYWTIVFIDDSTGLPVDDFHYSAPFFTTDNQGIVGLSHLFYVTLLTLDDTVLLKGMAAQNRVEILGSNPFRPLWFTLACSRFSAGNALDMSNVFYESGLFAYAEPDIMVSNMACSGANTTPCVNDTLFPAQWNLQNTGQNNGVSGVDIGYCNARQLSTGSSSIIVAVVDMGVDMTHPDLNNIHSFSYDAMSQSSPSVIYYKHGTECAGVIGASADNGIGIAGIAPGCPIMSISHDLSVSPDNAQKLSNAIYQAWTHGASVINNSWCSNDFPHYYIDNAIQDAVTNGRDGKGCVVVFASGNNNYSSVEYPALNPNVISVGAIDRCGMRSGRIDSGSGSCEYWGGFTTAIGSSYGNGLRVVAPGTHIPTTDLYNSILHTYYNEFNDGTSLACPHVSGVAALMLSVNSELTYTEVRDIIEQTAQKVGGYDYGTDTIHPNGTWNNEVGYGLVNAHKAVTVAKLFHTEYAITGSQNINLCQDYTYSLSGNVPDNFEIVWETSPYLYIVSGQGTPSVTVRALFPSAQNSIMAKVCFLGAVGKTVVSDNIVSTGQGHIPLCNVDTTFCLNTILSGSLSLGTTVYIDSGTTLTITDTIFCASSARIIVRPGGKLIVDGGTLTSACTGEMWKGIFVEGHSNLHQTAANQGTVVLRNGALIENALCGIRTGAPDDANNTSTGGIITAQNSTFHNCARAVDMRPYTDYTATGQLKPNVSSFTRCTFVLDPNHHFESCGARFSEHIRLWGVTGVGFTGCTFNNTTSENPHGSGILAEDAGFRVETHCSRDIVNSDCSCPAAYATHSSFNGFVTAIKVSTSGSPFAVIVDEASFANNGTGISVSGNNLTTVTRCQFDLSASPELPYCATGLELSACTGFLVEGNTFSRSTSSFPTYGIKVAGTGFSNNSLYRNTFSGLTYGIHSSGYNGGAFFGLRFSCNTFSQNTHDIYVADGQVAEAQGSTASGADNSFSSGATGNFEVLNPKFRLDYYYSTGGSHYPTVHTSNVLLHSNASANGCASTLCTGGGPIRGLSEYTALSVAMNTASAVCQNADDTANRASLLQEMSELAFGNIRGIMGSDTLDVDALKDWFSAVNETWSKYSLAETEYLSGASNALTLQGVSALLETEEERDEYDNYMAFNALKEALSGYLHGHADWPSATGTQIAELQRIADANTGRSSVMARGVLCFFFGICEDEDFTVMGDPRHFAATRENDISSHHQDVSMKLYPNPATNTLHVEFEGLDDPQGTITVADITGVVVQHAETSQHGVTIDVSHLTPGLYVVSFRNKNGVTVRKFVKM